MDDLARSLDELAAGTGLSGVVRVDRDGLPSIARAYGLADRRHGIAMTVDTQLAIASGTKGLTALAVMSLVEDGTLALDTTARSVLGDDLPLIGPDVTVEHLLGHRSGIGDYLDENDDSGDINDYVMTVPVHELDTAEAYLRVLDGFPAKAAPDEVFAYNNGGYVVLAVIAERAGGVSYFDLVHDRVCGPAGLLDTVFLRSDELPGPAATGYLAPDGLRTNLLHLPVRGCGDGGAFSTAADVHTFWPALLAGRIVSPASVEAMVRPRSDVPSESMRYGLGFWLHASNEAVMLVGFDAGVSFRSVHHPTAGFTHTVISNSSGGAWPITRFLDAQLMR